MTEKWRFVFIFGRGGLCNVDRELWLGWRRELPLPEEGYMYPFIGIEARWDWLPKLEWLTWEPYPFLVNDHCSAWWTGRTKAVHRWCWLRRFRLWKMSDWAAELGIS